MYSIKVSSFLAGYIAKKMLKCIFSLLVEWGRVGGKGMVWREIDRTKRVDEHASFWYVPE